jgi:hypothetical protein
MLFQMVPNSIGVKFRSSNIYPLGSGNWKLNNMELFRAVFAAESFYSYHLEILTEASILLDSLHTQMGLEDCDRTEADIAQGAFYMQLKSGVEILNLAPLEGLSPIRIICRRGEKLIQQTFGPLHFTSNIGDFGSERTAELYFKSSKGWDIDKAFGLIAKQTGGTLKTIEVEGEQVEYIVVKDNDFKVDLSSAYLLKPTTPDAPAPLQIVSVAHSGFSIQGEESAMKNALIAILGWEKLNFNCAEGNHIVIDFLYQYLTDSGFEVDKVTDGLNLIVRAVDVYHTVSTKVFQLVALYKQNPKYSSTIEIRSMRICNSNDQLEAFGLIGEVLSHDMSFDQKAFTYDQAQFAADLASQAGSVAIEGDSFIIVPITQEFVLDLGKFTMLPQEYTISFEVADAGKFTLFCDGLLDQSQIDIAVQLNAMQGIKIYGLGSRSVSYTLDQDVYSVRECYMTVLSEILKAGWLPVKTYTSSDGSSFNIDLQLVESSVLTIEQITPDLLAFFELEEKEGLGLFGMLGGTLGDVLSPLAETEEPIDTAAEEFLSYFDGSSEDVAEGEGIVFFDDGSDTIQTTAVEVKD